jgi:hypothetical protein
LCTFTLYFFIYLFYFFFQIYWAGPMAGGAGGSLLYDRLFSVAKTPANLRRAYLSRGHYAGVEIQAMAEESGGLEEALIEVKPPTCTEKSTSYARRMTSRSENDLRPLD